MKQIVLRPINKEDTKNILKWRNNKEVTKNFIYQKKLTKKNHEKWLKEMVETKKVAQFIIFDSELGQDIGSVYLRDIDYQKKEAEFGIFIGENSARGKGYGTEATKQIIRHGFDKLNLNKIFLRVFSENIGAINSYKKSGFLENKKTEELIINNKKQKIIFMEINS